MFGTLGFSELIIILVIVLIIFGAGRLPQIGEGVGKALKGFKKEVNEPPPQVEASSEPTAATANTAPPVPDAQPEAQSPPSTPAVGGTVLEAYKPGPELTPGTTAAIMAAGAGPQQPQPARAQTPVASSAEPAPALHGVPPPTLEERAAQPAPAQRATYPALPKSAQPKPAAKRPSAVVNKEAVARVQAQQAAMKAKHAQGSAPSPQDMQSLGEGIGETFRTFRQAAADVKNAIDPEVRTLRAEVDAAQKEIEQSIDAAKEMPAVQEDPPSTKS
ncbi:MAG: twin-arginine translocase TatA/TatE family subunit [Nitrospiraceae bacterium]